MDKDSWLPRAFARRTRRDALIADADVVGRILKHLKGRDPQPDTIAPAGPDPPWPKGETVCLTYHPVPDIA